MERSRGRDPSALAVLRDPGVAAALALFRAGPPLTRAQVAERTGWARVTVTARVEQLLASQLIRPVDGAQRRGRPAAHYTVAPDRAALLVAAVGASGMRLGRCNLTGGIEDRVDTGMDVARGPDDVLAAVRHGWARLSRPLGRRPVWGGALSLPGPIEFATGRVVDPPIMTGWNGFDVRAAVEPWFACHVHVENDVNAMAVGEAATAAAAGEPVEDLLLVKVGTGVGAGIISAGRVLRGAAGAAGDIGHTEAEVGDVVDVRTDRPRCRCGKLACLEAYAGGWALVRDARAAGLPVSCVDDLLELVAADDSVARHLVADAGRVLGTSIATAVSLLNPSRVVLGGSIGTAGEHLATSVRERVLARSLPLATRTLRIERSGLGHDAGVAGLAHELGSVVLGGGLEAQDREP